MKGFCYIICILCFGCSKINSEKHTPSCVKSKIKDFDKSVACPHTANVKEYSFQNKTVYVFNPGSCGADMTSEVIDENCNTLGFLGGLTGNSKINGEDFSKAKEKHTTWTNK